MYPILDLQQLGRADLHEYMRSLEEVVIQASGGCVKSMFAVSERFFPRQALDSVSGLKGERVRGLTGVWVQGHKLAAIGIRAKRREMLCHHSANRHSENAVLCCFRWVTYHGLALNVETDLAPFGNIVPCGIVGKPVGSVCSILAEEKHANGQLLKEYRFALIEAFQTVFGLEVQVRNCVLEQI